LKTFGTLVYADLWPGIDLVYHGTGDRVKYTFVVKPGADPTQIKLAYRGATAVRLTEAGQLDVRTPVGGFTDAAPVAYQEVDGQRVAVAATYTLEAEAAAGTWGYGFTLGSYDQSRPLVLDPVVLVYAGYIGGSGPDRAGTGDTQTAEIAVDAEGNAYVAGTTGFGPASFPVAEGPDLTYNGGSTDAFVAKVRADGTGLVYAGYIGGSGADTGDGIAVDSQGNAYVAGTTNSSEASFPVLVGPDLTYNGGTDAFVAKIAAFPPPPSSEPALVLLEPAAAVNPAGTNHTVTATVLDAAGQPVPSITVRFLVEAGDVPVAAGSCTTDAMGQCDFMYPGPQQAREDLITAYADTNTNSVQDEGEPEGTATKTWTALPVVLRSIDLAPVFAMNTQGATHTLMATVMDTPGGAVAGVVVHFDVTMANTTSGVCTTNTMGQCTFSYVGVNVGTDMITAFPDSNGNGVQDPDITREPSDEAVKLWTPIPPTPMEPGFATGGGQVPGSAGGSASFGFNAHSLPTVHGECTVIDHSTNPQTKVKCTDVTSATVVPNLVTGGGTATITGSGTINGIPMTYQIVTTDVAEPGTGQLYDYDHQRTGV
jgi:Beta-propeller repeat